MRLDERIGGVLVAPKKTMARLWAGEARAGDVALLVLLRLLAGELDKLAGAVSVARELGVGAAAQHVLMVSSAVLPDVVGILAAGMLLQLFSRAKNAFDVAAYAWIPYLTVQLASALYYTARGRQPSLLGSHVAEIAGVAWGAAVWIVALVESRKVHA